MSQMPETVNLTGMHTSTTARAQASVDGSEDSAFASHVEALLLVLRHVSCICKVRSVSMQ